MKKLEIGDWVRFPSVRFQLDIENGEEYQIGQIKEIDSYRNGTERCDIYADGMYHSYPVCNIDIVTESEAMLYILEH